jgi:putative glutamine amidotransferase
VITPWSRCFGDVLVSDWAPYHFDVTLSVQPMIGLSTYREEAAWGSWRLTSDLLPASYADSVRRGGGLAVLLPPGAAEPSVAATDVVGRLDGIVLTGGVDVDPARYGQAAAPQTDPPRPERDEWEIALVHAARAARRPILAVCRGLQVLNVALGGTLIQDLPATVGHAEHRGEIGTFIAHEIRIADDSVLAPIYGANADVHTHHHQAVDVLADELRATAWATDGTIEAATCPGPAWINGVQWHPEVAGGEVGARNLFRAFIAACQDAREART